MRDGIGKFSVIDGTEEDEGRRKKEIFSNEFNSLRIFLVSIFRCFFSFFVLFSFPAFCLCSYFRSLYLWVRNSNFPFHALYVFLFRFVVCSSKFYRLRMLAVYIGYSYWFRMHSERPSSTHMALFSISFEIDFKRDISLELYSLPIFVSILLKYFLSFQLEWYSFFVLCSVYVECRCVLFFTFIYW